MTTTTTTDKARAARKKKPLKTAGKVLTEYKKKYPEKAELVKEIWLAIKERNAPEYNPITAPVFIGIRSVILGSFLWAETKKGSQYWEKIFNNIDD
jgi:hypothetical protein